MDERVPGVTVPPETIERIEQADDESEAAYELALEQARAALATPGIRGIHLTDFRRDGALSRLCQDLGLTRKEERKRMHTVLSSPSTEVVIGPDRPFCIIGERINPTGRKTFAGGRAGDLSQVVKDVEEQAAMGAHVLDVNMGVRSPTRQIFCLARSPSCRSTPTCRSYRLLDRRGARSRPGRVRRQGPRQLGHLRARAARARAATRQAARSGGHLPRQRRDGHSPDGGRAARDLQAPRRDRPRRATRSRSRTWSSTRSR